MGEDIRMANLILFFIAQAVGFIMIIQYGSWAGLIAILLSVPSGVTGLRYLFEKLCPCLTCKGLRK